MPPLPKLPMHDRPQAIAKGETVRMCNDLHDFDWRCWIGTIMRGPLGTWFSAPAGDREEHPPGLETPHNTDTVHYFLDQRNGVLTWAVIGGNNGLTETQQETPT